MLDFGGTSYSTYKTTLRVIRRLWGVGVQRFATPNNKSFPHCTRIEMYHTDITSVSQLHHILSTSLAHRCHIGITTVSHQGHINIEAVSYRYRNNITIVSCRHLIAIKPTYHRYHSIIAAVSNHNHMHRYHTFLIIITFVSHQHHADIA